MEGLKKMASEETYNDMISEKVITKKELKKIMFRSYLLQSSFNYERMQAGGWTYSLIPGLKKIHRDKEDLALSLENHLQFMNTNPQLVTFMHGVIIAMEESKESPKSIQAIKTALMGPLGGIGDALFYLTVLPIVQPIGSQLSLEGNILGPIVFLLLFNIPYMAAKIGLINLGYKMGVKAISVLSESTKKLSRSATIVGISVVGALIPKSVQLTTTFVFRLKDTKLDLQTQLFDTIMPNLLPLVFTLFCFIMLKKGRTPIALIIFTVIFGLLGSLIGII
ncbi:PTS system mannose/fructose/sorbose family transporter subunit IID [Enterococcus faecalis]|nr:PTS system mannose/fructose/sorbose family transporter subunit IID [Enterococcus faecalis]